MAGVQSVIIPFSNDQFAWAHSAYDLGVGSKPIYKNNLASDSMAEFLSYSLDDKIATNSKKLGEKIAKENSAKACTSVLAELIERKK